MEDLLVDQGQWIGVDLDRTSIDMSNVMNQIPE